MSAFSTYPSRNDMTTRTPMVSFRTRPNLMLVELNRAWAEARAGKATRAETIARYVGAGLAEADAACIFDMQWAGFQAFPHDPRVGDLGMDDFPIANIGQA